MENFVKRFVTKDGKTRVTVYFDEYADNPREMTDEPLHCEDFNRGYSIMNKTERENKSDSVKELIVSFIASYGNIKAIKQLLVNNGKHLTDGKCIGNNALVYDRSGKQWILKGYSCIWNNGQKEYKWTNEDYFDCKLEDIDVYSLFDYMEDSTIDELCNDKYISDRIKIASYSFDYNGRMSFSDSFDTDSEGICWLSKNEFLKYSGQTEDYWKNNSLLNIEWLTKELKSWSENEVYYFKTETKVEYNIKKTCISEDRETEDYNQPEWEEDESCGGYYGELEDVLDDILDCAGYTKEELEEVTF